MNSPKQSSPNTTLVEKSYINCSTKPSSYLNENEMSGCETDSSSDGMEIVISESPKKQKKEINIEDKKVLENIEEEIEKQLDEKAAKSNLTATNVKNILKHVISNEHVLAMVRHTVDEDSDDDSFVYEPKLTRAKAKELSEKQQVPMPWVKPLKKPVSEIHLLINEELPEDSDDDEYVPQECESEDDRERSDLDSEPATPQTPLSMNDSATQTNWTEDGIFKIPPHPDTAKTDEAFDDENIALRTRSKLSLSDTLLENIEEAFIPPDITTDMYDFECDDEDWKDFLKKFTRPLDEAVQGTQEDDDEADPEYNVLADEEIVDQEELREDKAVKVTKKELSTLVAELFDYNELFQTNEEQYNPNNSLNGNNSLLISNENNQNSSVNSSFQINNDMQQEIYEIETVTINESTTEADIQSATIITIENSLFSNEQMQLLQQQLRQHVQLVTQNYLQTYKHPNLSDMAKTYKDCLVTLSEMGKYKAVSAFHIANLDSAVQLSEEWEQKFEDNDPEIESMMSYVKNVVDTSIIYRKKKNYDYVVTFAPYYLKTVSTSEVFMYPDLLPKVPFRCDLINAKNFYILPENALIALGLEQFEKLAEEDQFHKTRFKKMRLADAAFYICEYLMPCREASKVYNYIKQMNEKSAAINPIKEFLTNHKPHRTTHIISPLEEQGLIPPCLRPPESLPYQWRKFNFPSPKPKPPTKTVKPKSKRTKKPKPVLIPNPAQAFVILNNGELLSAVPIAKLPIPRLVRPVKEARNPRKRSIKNDPKGLEIKEENVNQNDATIVQELEKTDEVTKTRSGIKRTLEENILDNNIKRVKHSPECQDYVVQSGENSRPKGRKKKKSLPKRKQIKKLDINTTKSPIKEPIIPYECSNDSYTIKINEINEVDNNNQVSHELKHIIENLDLETKNSSCDEQSNKTNENTKSVINKLCNNCQKIIDKSKTLNVKKSPLKESTRVVAYNNSINKLSLKLKQLIQLIKYRSGFVSIGILDKENMLPSMPHLLTPCKIQEDDTFEHITTKDDDKKTEIESVPDVSSPTEEIIIDKKDNEEELNALMVASSTIQKCRKLPPSSTEKRKLKQKREYNATLAMLSPEDPIIEDEKSTNFAKAYYDKVQERLESESPCDYQRFMEVLTEHDESTSSFSNLYEKVETILSPKYPDLIEEFLTFLTPEQAKQIGKLVPHFMLTNMSIFLRKLEIYFSNQPAQLRKIYNSLMELSNKSGIQMENIKSVILPLLKGNSLLINWFLQMFPIEPPPESLMTDWETIQCDDDGVDEANDTYEYITIPEVEDPYGGPNCICKCHQIDDEMYASRARHCIPCGTKFLQGRVYVQTGKGLRLANVTFNNNPSSDPYKRLSVQPTGRIKRKSETSPSKTLMSPTKDEEPRHSNESEDDKEELSKSTKKSVRITNSPKVRQRNRSTPKTNPRKPTVRPTKDILLPRKIHLNSKKLDLAEIKSEPLEPLDPSIVCKTESEPECDLKSPEHSTESLDTCEESSQDTINHPNSDNDSDNVSIGEVESVSDGSEESGKEDDNDLSSWTRNEDKVILQMFQQHNDNEQLFSKIQASLNRSIPEIKQRFSILLNLLKKIKSDNSS